MSLSEALLWAVSLPHFHGQPACRHLYHSKRGWGVTVNGLATKRTTAADGGNPWSPDEQWRLEMPREDGAAVLADPKIDKGHLAGYHCTWVKNHQYA